MAVEYPSYGVYTHQTEDYEDSLGDEKIFREDSSDVFDFVKERLGLKKEQIVIFGRSIGTGVATLLADQKKGQFGSLVLFSPLKSIKSAASDFLWFAGWMAPNMFTSESRIGGIKEPTYFVHGQKDTVIPFEHAKALNEKSGARIKRLTLPTLMTHNNFHLENDIIRPMKEFFEEVYGKKTKEGQTEGGLGGDYSNLHQITGSNFRKALRFKKSDSMNYYKQNQTSTTTESMDS